MVCREWDVYFPIHPTPFGFGTSVPFGATGIDTRKRENLTCFPRFHTSLVAST